MPLVLQFEDLCKNLEELGLKQVFVSRTEISSALGLGDAAAYTEGIGNSWCPGVDIW